MKNILYLAVVLSVVGSAWPAAQVTPSEQCSGQNVEGLRDRIEVVPCSKKRCTLRRGTNTTVYFKFRPEHEVKSLVNEVYANIGGISLPFIGVHANSACAHVTDAETGAPAPCPLAPHREYLYTNVFFIENFYPTVGLRVHWALNDGKRDVICFEVPAVIHDHTYFMLNPGVWLEGGIEVTTFSPK